MVDNFKFLLFSPKIINTAHINKIVKIKAGVVVEIPAYFKDSVFL